jgi:hypothetical protein
MSEQESSGTAAAFTGPVIEENANNWFNPNAFSLEAVGTFGNVEKNPLRPIRPGSCSSA